MLDFILTEVLYNSGRFFLYLLTFGKFKNTESSEFKYWISVGVGFIFFLLLFYLIQYFFL